MQDRQNTHVIATYRTATAVPAAVALHRMLAEFELQGISVTSLSMQDTELRLTVEGGQLHVRLDGAALGKGALQSLCRPARPRAHLAAARIAHNLRQHSGTVRIGAGPGLPDAALQVAALAVFSVAPPDVVLWGATGVALSLGEFVDCPPHALRDMVPDAPLPQFRDRYARPPSADGPVAPRARSLRPAQVPSAAARPDGGTALRPVPEPAAAPATGPVPAPVPAPVPVPVPVPAPGGETLAVGQSPAALPGVLRHHQRRRSAFGKRHMSPPRVDQSSVDALAQALRMTGSVAGSLRPVADDATDRMRVVTTSSDADAADGVGDARTRNISNAVIGALTVFAQPGILFLCADAVRRLV